VRVRDAGSGGARPGGGLRGMEDRLAAVGGTLDIVSPHGAGTHVKGVIPCGS
jgi:signal transduction histidine kinase